MQNSPREIRWCRTALLTVVLLAACAPLATPAVKGARVSVQREGQASVTGELLAVSADSVWIQTALSPRRLEGYGLAGLSAARVQRIAAGRRGIAGGAVFGAITGGMLAASVSSGRGSEMAGVFLSSLGISVLLAWAAETEARATGVLDLAPPTSQSLRPYARFPQGLPPGYR